MPSQNMDSLLGLSLRAGETNLRVRGHVLFLILVTKERGGRYACAIPSHSTIPPL